MQLETIEYKDKKYLSLQSKGWASRYCREFAMDICKGDVVLDIGYSREDWKFPNAIGIDLADNNEYHAMNLPPLQIDAIHSSHFLEHYIGRFQDVIEYWLTRLKSKGIIFLYLPNCSYQKYWAWGNKKHVHYLTPELMNEYCEQLEGIDNFIVTEGYDLNGSFYCIIQKK